jgi:catalase
VRFSNSSGDPDVHDGIANARALAAKFQLLDGKNADILALHIEGFPARTPDEFLAFLRTQLPDPPTGKTAPDAVPRFLDSHPAARAHSHVVVVKAAIHSVYESRPKEVAALIEEAAQKSQN